MPLLAFFFFGSTDISQYNQTCEYTFIYTVFNVQAYQTSQYVVLHGGIFLSKWRGSVA